MRGFRKARLLIGIGVFFLFIGLVCVIMEGNVAISKLSGNPALDYNTALESEYSDGREFSGTLYEVYDCVAAGYTEYSDTNTTTTDSYYYVVDCPYSTLDTIMIMKIDADTEFETSVDELWEAFYYAETEEEFLTYAIPFTGVITKADSEIMQLTKNWRTENEWDDIKISAYMLDTTVSVSTSVTLFLVGVGCLVLFVAYIVILILVFIKNKGKTQPAYSGYTPNTFDQQYNSFAPQQPQSNNFIPQAQSNGFIPQSQPQSNNFVSQAQSNGFIPQSQPQSDGFISQSQPQSDGFIPQAQPQSNGFIPQAQPQSDGFIPQAQPQSNNTSINLNKEIDYDFGFKNNNP